MTTPSGAPGPLLRGAGQRAVGEVSPLTTNSSKTELWPARVRATGRQEVVHRLAADREMENE